MKLLFLALVLLLSSVQPTSAQQWESLNGPTGEGSHTIYAGPSGNVYLLTLESNLLLRSRDSGESWERLARDLQPRHVQEMQNGNILIVSGNSLLRSTNQGLTWQEVLQSEFFINSVHVRSESISVATTRGGWRSTNGGSTWTSIVIGPDSLGLGLLYQSEAGTLIAIANTDRDRPIIHRSTDNGITWGKIINFNNYLRGVTLISQTKSGTLLLFADGSFTSKDEGRTWQSAPELPKSAKSVAHNADETLVATARNVVLSKDDGLTWIASNDLPFDIGSVTRVGASLWVGGEGAVHTSRDAQRWTQKPVPTSRVRDLVVASGQSVTALRSYWAYTLPQTGTWKPSTLRSQMNGGWLTLATDSLGSALALASNYDPALGLYRSDQPDKQTWQTPSLSWFSHSSSDLMVDNMNYYYVLSPEGVYRSTDRGLTWDNYNSGLPLPTYGDIIDGPGDALYLAISNRVYRSTDRGQRWTRLPSLLPDSVAEILSLRDGSLLAALRDSGLHRSTDEGVSWSKYNMGLLGQSIHSLLQTRSGDLFAATDSSVFRYYAAAERWLDYSAGMWATGILSMTYDSAGHLLVGSNGGGVFRSIETFGAAPTASVDNASSREALSLRSYPNPATEVITVMLGSNVTEARVTLIDALGRTVLASELVGNTVDLPVRALARGMYVLRIEAEEQVATQLIMLR